MKRCIEYIKEHHDILVYNDQDVLNYILHDTKRFISIEYNFLSLFVVRNTFYRLDAEMQQIVRNCSPLVIHYVKPKPWTIFSYKFPLTEVWEKYSKISLWRAPWFKELPKEKPFNYFIKRYFLWPFGIKFHIFKAIDEYTNTHTSIKCSVLN